MRMWSLSLFFVKDLLLISALNIGLGVEFASSGIHCDSPTQSGWSRGPASVGSGGDIGSRWQDLQRLR